MADLTLALLGTGKLGGALATGWRTADALTSQSLRLYNPTRQRAEALAVAIGATVSPNPNDAVAGADVVVLAMKPHALPSALAALRETLQSETLVVSVAAGVRTASIEELLPGQPVVRALPTVAARICRSATAFCAGTQVRTTHVHTVQALFATIGGCVEVTESQMDAALGVASSGIAFAYLFLEALIDGGVRTGLPREQARILAIQTLAGAAAMANESTEHPGALKDQVTTPGGTTIAGLEVLEAAGMRGSVIQAVRAAAERSRELG